MKKVRIDTITDIRKGKKIIESETGIYNYISIENLHSKTYSKKTNCEGIKCEKEDVLIAWDGANAGLVGVGFEGVIGSTLAKISLKPNYISKVNPIYFYRYLDSKFDYIKSQRTGATIPHVNGNHLRSMEIPLPPLPQQKAIAAQLDKAQELVQYNEQLIEKYDELQQSLFLDMFGDPVINEKGWEMVEFEDILSLKRGYDLSMSNRNLDGNIDVYGSNGILSKHDSYKVDSPIIITGRSGTIGKVFISNDKCWPLNTTLYSYKTNENNIIYLSFLMRFFRLERFSHGVGVPTLDRNIVHKEKLPKIPLALQNDFAQKIDSIEIQKEQAKEALAKSKDIFQGLLQEHFM